MADLVADLTATIRDIPDFPKPGILFKDITPILHDPALFERTIAHFAERFAGQVDSIVGMESRGFLFGTPLAIALQVPFVLARKPGKLPYDSVGFEYELEYGTNRLEMHVDSFNKGDRVLIIDDLLATGGTANPTGKLVEQLGGEVAAYAFVIELGFLSGRDQLGGKPVESILIY